MKIRVTKRFDSASLPDGSIVLRGQIIEVPDEDVLPILASGRFVEVVPTLAQVRVGALKAALSGGVARSPLPPLAPLQVGSPATGGTQPRKAGRRKKVAPAAVV